MIIVGIVLLMVLLSALLGYVWVEVSYRRDRAQMRQALEQHDRNFHETYVTFLSESNPLVIAYHAAETDAERDRISTLIQQQLDSIVGRMW